MILAGNQSKQRGPLHNLSTSHSPATEFPSEICSILHDRHTDVTVLVLVAISCPDNMQLH